MLHFRSSAARVHQVVSVLTGLNLWAAASAAGGSEAEQPLPNYFTHMWQNEDGLPNNAVTALVQTRDGFLWLGTYNGLVWFDGVRFTVYDASNTPALRSSRVTSLFEDPEQTLWIGLESGELARLRAGQFEPIRVTANWTAGKLVGLGTGPNC